MKMDNYYRRNNGIFWVEPKNDDDYIWRFEGNPIVDLNKTDFWHMCNSATIFKDGKYVGLFRAEDKRGCPILVKGESSDGVNFTFENKQVDFRNTDGTPFEMEYAYDPRLVEIEGDLFAIFCADINGPSIYICKIENDFSKFTMIPSGFLPFNRNGVLFTEKIDGYYHMLSRPSDDGNTPFGNIYISESSDLIHWGNHKLVSKNFNTGRNFWERIKIGAGPSPIKTDEGWLLIYHGVQSTCSGYTYSFSVMLLDLKDPSKVIYKADRYLLSPEKEYERVGFTNNVCFPTCALCDEEGHITIYYGVADTNMAIAFTTVDKLLKFVKKFAIN